MASTTRKFPGLLAILDPSDERVAALREFARQDQNTKSPVSLEQRMLKHAADVLQQSQVGGVQGRQPQSAFDPIDKGTASVISGLKVHDAVPARKISRKHTRIARSVNRSADRVCVLEIRHPLVLPFMRTAPTATSLAAARLLAADSVGARIPEVEACRAIDLAQLIPEDLRLHHLSWLSAEIQIRRKTKESETRATYRAVTHKHGTKGSASLVISLLAPNGNRATAVITSTSGATDLFEGGELPNDWDLLEISLQILE